VSMVALCFASATVFDILLFRNYAAVPFHASSALVVAAMAVLVWALGKRNRL
jgi:hypothetical protein